MSKKIRDPLLIKTPSLKTCQPTGVEERVGPFAMVIFGGGGDLAQRKLLPALYYLYDKDQLADEFAVLGVGHPELSDGGYRDFAASILKTFSTSEPDPKRSADFLSRLYFLYGSLDDDKLYENVCRRLETLAPPGSAQESNILFYMAVPPRAFPVAIEKLEKFKLCGPSRRAKLIAEKPFGKDRDSAAALNRLILRAFRETEVYRIDHYLAKETVQNILFLRFGNSVFEPLWNARTIDHVQITVAEQIGVEHRGSFYEQVGVVRDIVQNHLLQLLALVAMEPPAGFEADLIRDEKIKVFRSLRRLESEDLAASAVRGQYGPGQIGGLSVQGYREEPKVSQTSEVPTFFAGKFFIDNWRWAGVPFYLRTGKRLPRRISEIYIEFKQLPLRLFGKTCQDMEPNGLILSIQPDEEICLRLTVKTPGMGNVPSSVNMEMNYEKSFGATQHPAYERVIIDCLKGDLTLFSRQDEVDTTWSILDPLIKQWESHPAPDFPNYPAGTWGPPEALRFIMQDGRSWRFSDDRG